MKHQLLQPPMHLYNKTDDHNSSVYATLPGNLTIDSSFNTVETLESKVDSSSRKDVLVIVIYYRKYKGVFNTKISQRSTFEVRL